MGGVDGEEAVDLEELDDHLEVDQSGVRVPRKLPNPCLPSRAEVEAHELTHLPFRNWCRHCLAGRGKELAHRRSEK